MTGRCLLPLRSLRKEKGKRREKERKQREKKRGRSFGAHDQRWSCAYVFYLVVCVCFRIGELTTLLELNSSSTLNSSRFVSSVREKRYSPAYIFSRCHFYLPHTHWWPYIEFFLRETNYDWLAAVYWVLLGYKLADSANSRARLYL